MVPNQKSTAPAQDGMIAREEEGDQLMQWLLQELEPTRRRPKEVGSQAWMDTTSES